MRNKDKSWPQSINSNNKIKLKSVQWRPFKDSVLKFHLQPFYSLTNFYTKQ